MEPHGQSGAPIDKFYIDRNNTYSVKISPNPLCICTEHLEEGLVTNKQLPPRSTHGEHQPRVAPLLRRLRTLPCHAEDTTTMQKLTQLGQLWGQHQKLSFL